jgi:hypothetical protein
MITLSIDMNIKNGAKYRRKKLNSKKKRAQKTRLTHFKTINYIVRKVDGE